MLCRLFCSRSMARLLLLLIVVWYWGTQLENKFRTGLSLREYIGSLEALRNDESIPLYTHNLVHLEGSNEGDTIDRDILYSILDKDPKRAQAYWFISIKVLDDPDKLNYELETFGTDFIYRVKLNIGYKCHQHINVYIRQIVQQLQTSGELPVQDKKHSIYEKSTVGGFKFCLIQSPKTFVFGLYFMGFGR